MHELWKLYSCVCHFKLHYNYWRFRNLSCFMSLRHPLCDCLSVCLSSYGCMDGYSFKFIKPICKIHLLKDSHTSSNSLSSSWNAFVILSFPSPRSLLEDQIAIGGWTLICIPSALIKFVLVIQKKKAINNKSKQTSGVHA